MTENDSSPTNTANSVSSPCVEAPVTWKAYLVCAFATSGGIFFGFASGYINGVSGLSLFITAIEGANAESFKSSHQSFIVSILSCGTFSVSSYLFPLLPIVVIFLIHIALAGALMAGDHADFYGRRPTIRMFDLQTSLLVYHPDRYTS